MFKTLDIRSKYGFWRLSADTGSPITTFGDRLPSTKLRAGPSGLFLGGWPSKSAISMAVCIIPESAKSSIKIEHFDKKLTKNSKTGYGEP